MAVRAISTFSGFPTFFSSPIHRSRSCKLSLLGGSVGDKWYNVQQLSFAKVHSCELNLRIPKIRKKFGKRQFIVMACDFDFADEAIEADAVVEPVEYTLDGENVEDVSPPSSSHFLPEENGGKPGFVSFSNHQPRRKLVLSSETRKNQSSLLWLIGPAVLVASYVFPSLYLRRILSTIFEDSLLTDFLILFFTEALFYCGVAIFLFLTNYLWGSAKPTSAINSNARSTSLLGHRISSVAVLILSLIIPMVTMGFVWPWTGPAASAALAPYLVGIVIQFAFEQYARYLKSPSWPVIPIIFQVYRLHQLNRAAQLVTALSFTVRGAEMTAHNVAINNSLGTLMNVLQLLGVICIWSLSSFVMKFFPASAMNEQ